MAVPKKKSTSMRRDKRRSHDGLKTPNLTECSHCKELKQSHRVCTNCGYYNGREVLIISD